MNQWEYRVLPVRWDDGKSDWVGHIHRAPPETGIEQVVGWDAVLEHYGAFGWELVSVMPSGMYLASRLQEALAFFKRPCVAETWQ